MSVSSDFEIKNALVVGYGSIGKRHVDVMRDLGVKTSIYSRRILPQEPVFQDLRDALKKVSPQYIVIANETSEHIDTLKSIFDHGFSGLILVEKPITNNRADVPLWPNQFTSNIGVGYNLRFHPVLQKARELSTNLGQILSINIHCGQYLPSWRPEQDYRQSYSASKAKGGGALRDLSHDIDYCQWFGGMISELFAVGGHVSKLDISSDDVFNIIGTTALGILVNLHLNYLDQITRRTMSINFDCETLVVNLLEGSLVSKTLGTFKFECSQNDSYKAMHKSMMTDRVGICGFEEALSVMSIIEACERSARDKTWQRDIHA